MASSPVSVLCQAFAFFIGHALSNLFNDCSMFEMHCKFILIPAIITAREVLVFGSVYSSAVELKTIFVAFPSLQMETRMHGGVFAARRSGKCRIIEYYNRPLV